MATSTAPTTDEALQYAVRMIGESEVDRGRQALTWVLQREPDNVAAWLWMEKCLSDPQQKTECLQKVSSLSPF